MNQTDSFSHPSAPPDSEPGGQAEEAGRRHPVHILLSCKGISLFALLALFLCFKPIYSIDTWAGKTAKKCLFDPFDELLQGLPKVLSSGKVS